jgi:hypothetical protein
VTTEYAETLEEIQDIMWLNPNNQNYKFLAIYFVNIKYYKLLSEGRKQCKCILGICEETLKYVGTNFPFSHTGQLK